MSSILSRRRWARDEIASLDPVADHERITHLFAEVRFGDPALAAAFYTVAFTRQMAIPSIAAVVHRGGRSPIMTGTRKRNDDTLVFFGEFMRHGHASPEGRAAIERLNDIHAQFPIENHQSLYTLASFIFEAVRVPRLLGLELMTEKEQQANFLFWCGVGERMGLSDIPPTLEAFDAWMRAYEREHWGWSAGGAAVARAMIDDFGARWPRPLQRLARQFIPTLLEDELLDALRITRPTPFARRLTRTAVRGYLAARAVLPDHGERSWTDSFGAEYGGCPHMPDVGYRPGHDRATTPGCPMSAGPVA